MSWHLRILVAVLAAGTINMFSDWLFMGVLFHERYNRYPEVWWPGLRSKAADTRAILIASALGYLTALGVAALCIHGHAHSIPAALFLAFAAWLAGPLVMQVTNGFWIKTDPLITVAHSAGWLARFLIAGLAAGILLA
ncbi:MAG TPA: DUF1761 family protein [Rhizomicrobium sp.]|jgi:hypothetical protein|nr:DUF1761 family protein [Rhizomicrobium sp.]